MFIIKVVKNLNQQATQLMTEIANASFSLSYRKYVTAMFDGTVSSFGSGVQSTMYKMSMHTKETWKTFDVFLSSELLIKNKLAAVFLWVSYPTEVEIVSYSDTLSIAWDFGSRVESKQLLEVPTGRAPECGPISTSYYSHIQNAVV